MPHGADKPVANRVSFALTPLETGAGGDWTLISKGTAGVGGGGGDEGDEGDAKKARATTNPMGQAKTMAKA